VKDPDMDEEEHVAVAFLFFVVGFIAAFVGVYLTTSLGTALIMGGLFFLAAALWVQAIGY
jgi:hypothetical protein